MKYPHTDLIERPNLHWFNEYSDLRCIEDGNLTGYVQMYEIKGKYKWEILDGSTNCVANGISASPTLAQTTVEHILDVYRTA